MSKRSNVFLGWFWAPITVVAFGIGFLFHELLLEQEKLNAKKSVNVVRFEEVLVDQEPDGTLTLAVDYSRSLKDFIASGKFDIVEESITPENFPLTKEENGLKELQFKLYYFGYSQQKSLTHDYIVAQMDKHGKRPATLRELIAFCEANPAYYGEFVIWALGSVWTDPKGDHFIPWIGRFNKDRTRALYLQNMDESPVEDKPEWRYPIGHRFLAVNKYRRVPKSRDD